MPQLPIGWEETTLGEISITKQYWYTESASFEEIGPKFLRITDIQDDFVNWETVPYCPISDADYKKYKLDIGDIVIARTGNSTGATTVIKKHVDAVFASYLIRFKVDFQRADYKFIDFLLRSRLWKDFVKSIKSGSAQWWANANSFASFPIHLPPLPEQKAIAAVLSSFDDKIDLLRAENQTLEQMGQELFKEWFGSPLTPWRGNWDSLSTSWSKEKSPLGDLGAILPEGWREYELLELVNTVNWYSYKWDELLEKSNEALVTLKSFDRNWWFQTRWFKEFSWTPKKEHEVFIWDLIVAHTDLTQNAEVLGNPAFIVNDWWFEKLYITMDLVKVESKNENISKSFLYFLMKTRAFKWHCVWYSNWTTVLHLSKKAIPEFKIVLPKDLSWLKEKSVAFDLIMKKISHNFSQIDGLTESRDQLLPKLMSGEVRVGF